MTVAENNLPNVRYEVAGKETDLSDAPRIVRRIMTSVGKKQAKKYAKYVHPVTGERPDVIVAILDPSTRSAHVRLSTDSKELNEWLKSQGLEIGTSETVTE